MDKDKIIQNIDTTTEEDKKKERFKKAKFAESKLSESEFNEKADLPPVDRLDEIHKLLTEITVRQNKQQDMMDDLFEDINVMMKPLLSQGIKQLQEFEEKGYFQFVNGMKTITDNVVGHYSQQELELFANSIGMVLDTLRSLTQPDVLTLANNMTHTLRTADRLKPIGFFGMARATKNKEVQKGLAVAVELLKQLGQVKHNAEALPPGALGSTKRSHEQKKASKNNLNAFLAPKNRKVNQTPKPSSVPKSPAAVATKGYTTSQPIVEGFEFTKEGFLANPDQWTEELGAQIAKAIGIEELSPTQWKLINHARGEYLKTKATPNIRALSVGSGVSTKEIYSAFPHSPAKTIAKVAGITKPVGCI